MAENVLQQKLKVKQKRNIQKIKSFKVSRQNLNDDVLEIKIDNDIKKAYKYFIAKERI
jgi:hypothetical protein